MVMNHSVCNYSFRKCQFLNFSNFFVNVKLISFLSLPQTQHFLKILIVPINFSCLQKIAKRHLIFFFENIDVLYLQKFISILYMMLKNIFKPFISLKYASNK